MAFKTTDLCDAHGDQVQAAAPVFKAYGAVSAFCGTIRTVKVFEDNALVRQLLSQKAAGNVLVVDGGGSLRCALVGDQLAALAHGNGWSGLIVNGCIRDRNAISEIAIGVCALATHPARSRKIGAGEIDIPVSFAGVTFTPGHYLYADEDGIIVTRRALTASGKG